MPRPRKPPRLWLRPDERCWVILDGKHQERTGCREEDRDGAEAALQAYLAEKFSPVARERDPGRVSVAEALTAYGTEHAPYTAAPEAIGWAISALLDFWGDKYLSDIRGQTCRDYQASRPVSDTSVRRELANLAAAVNHWHREHGPLTAVPKVTLPPKAPPRERWLTRSEAAQLLAGALGWRKDEDSGRWHRDPALAQRHLARFILLGLHTGTRHGALLGVQWLPNTTGGHVDLEAGMMYRRAATASETKKRQTPVKLGRRILAHLRRWKRLDDEARAAAAEASPKPALFLNVVSYFGRPIAKIRRSWAVARQRAGLGADVTPHVMRHSRATWMMKAGVDRTRAAQALGMSVRTYEAVYGHFDPDWQQEAAEV